LAFLVAAAFTADALRFFAAAFAFLVAAAFFALAVRFRVAAAFFALALRSAAFFMAWSIAERQENNLMVVRGFDVRLAPNLPFAIIRDAKWLTALTTITHFTKSASESEIGTDGPSLTRKSSGETVSYLNSPQTGHATKPSIADTSVIPNILKSLGAT
jgi:hypothetical protein